LAFTKLADYSQEPEAVKIPTLMNMALVIEREQLSKLTANTANAQATVAQATDRADAQLAQWILAISQQDETALGLLYDATCARVYGLAMRIVRNLFSSLVASS
jgi:hypothetical protein